LRLNKPVLFMALAAWPANAQDEPLSAIDWLNSETAVTVAQPRAATPGEPPVSDGVDVPDVDVMPLDTAIPDAVGLLPQSTTGLPPSLWQESRASRIMTRLKRLPDRPLPATQALYYTLVLAEAEPPADIGEGAPVLKARIEALRRYGAVAPARALLERAGPVRREVFDQWLDLALLDGAEDAPCRALVQDPRLSADYAARIFCMARSGDWNTAALTFETAEALDLLPPVQAALLAQFLDPEVMDGAPSLAPPGDMTPLTFRLFEAVGRPMPTRNLPRAFAMADLRGTSGWKAELEAAERLARTGALPANRLLGLYTDRKPAASGGVWDRVEAVQAFDRALTREAPEDIARTLPPVWSQMRAQGLAVVFAEMFGDALSKIELTGTSRQQALQVALLSPAYETAAQSIDAQSPLAFHAGLAQGTPSVDQAKTPEQQAIAKAFSSTAPAPRDAPLLEAGKLGEAILAAATRLDRAGPADTDDLTAALSTLRAVGLEDTARRAALQRLLLDGEP